MMPRQSRLGRTCGLWAGVALIGLLSGGCGSPPPAMASAAQQVTFQLWGDPGEPPTVIQTDELTDHSGTFEHMSFAKLTVRRPFPDTSSDASRHAGVIVLTAPTGAYDRSSPDDGHTGPADSILLLDGPVLFSGELQGEPLVGAGAYAKVERAGNRMEIHGDAGAAVDDPQHQVDIVYQGRLMRSWRFVLTSSTGGSMDQGPRQVQIDSQPYSATISDDAPAIGLALAALPRPLVLPGVLPSSYGP